MAITRRQFLKRTGLATAGHAARPEPLRQPVRPRRRSPTRSATATSSCIFLDGGNDGLNTVIPVDNGGGTLRTRLRATAAPAAAASTCSPAQLAGTPIGTDPEHRRAARAPSRASDRPARQLYDAGKRRGRSRAAAIPSTASRTRSRASSGRPANPLGIGASPAPAGSAGTSPAHVRRQPTSPASASATSVAGEFRQTATSVLAIRRLERLRLPVRRLRRSDDARRSAPRSQALHERRGRELRSRRCSYIGNSGRRDAAQQRELSGAARPLRDATRASCEPTAYDDRRPQHRRATSARSRRSSTASSSGVAERQRALLPARATAATTRTPTRAAPRPTASTTTCTRRSATRSRSSTTTSPTCGVADKRLRRSSGASSAAASRRTTTAPTTARRGRCS